MREEQMNNEVQEELLTNVKKEMGSYSANVLRELQQLDMEGQLKVLMYINDIMPRFQK